MKGSASFIMVMAAAIAAVLLVLAIGDIMRTEPLATNIQGRSCEQPMVGYVYQCETDMECYEECVHVGDTNCE